MRGVRGVTKHHEQVMDYTTRQWMDLFSPSNFIGTNPEVLGALKENQTAIYYLTAEDAAKAAASPIDSPARAASARTPSSV